MMGVRGIHMSEIKIGFWDGMNAYPPSTGGSVHLYQMMRKLSERGCRIYKYYKDDENPFVHYIRKRDFLQFLKVPDLYYVRIDGRYFNEKFNWWKYFKIINKPIIWEINSPIEEELWHTKIDIKTLNSQNRARYRLARTTDAATAVSREMAEYARNVLGIPKVKYVPNGSDPKMFYRHKELHPLLREHENKLKVVWSGSGEYIWQNVGFIEKTAERLMQTNSPIHFFIIGKIKRNESLKNVTYIDSVPYLEIPELLGSADVGLCLYRIMEYEPYGFHLSPLKLYDYLASELVVIGSNLGQIAEVIEDGRNGYLVDDNVNNLVSLLEMISRNPSRAVVMAAEGRKAVENYYHWDRAADDTLELIRECI
jgi:glycosyltransferase involved in cell wall biosynthesis